MAIRLAVVGCLGRMGRSIIAQALKDKDVSVRAAIESRDNLYIGSNLKELLREDSIDIKVSDNLEKVADDIDVIIDFTSPAATISTLSIARGVKIPIVVGTTGLMDEELKVLKSTSGLIPVLYSANMSIGINLLFKLLPELTTALGDDYDIEIIEIHHNKKKDSPSGTAKRLAKLIADAKGASLDKLAVYGREGNVGQRPKGEIGIHAIRAGNVIGEHTIVFAGRNERIEITHRATSRDVFAQGAIRAAKYIFDKSPGLYNMQDVLTGI